MGARRLIEFDIDKYIRNSKKLDLSFLDWDAIPEHELSDGDVMSMHYMMDIETHTVIYLRDLLGTRAANDPQITAFLACWVYEELWHGEAFSDFLRAYGIEVPAEPKLPDGSSPLPTRAKRTQRIREQLCRLTARHQVQDRRRRGLVDEVDEQVVPCHRVLVPADPVEFDRTRMSRSGDPFEGRSPRRPAKSRDDGLEARHRVVHAMQPGKHLGAPVECHRQQAQERGVRALAEPAVKPVENGDRLLGAVEPPQEFGLVDHR